MSASIRIVVPCALVLGFAAGTTAQAQNFGPPELRETWVDSSRTQVWMNGFGECWHSQFGPPPPPNQCGPAVVAQYVPPRAPVSVAIAPPPQVAPRPAVIAAPPPAPAPVYVAPVMAPRRDRN